MLGSTGNMILLNTGQLNSDIAQQGMIGDSSYTVITDSHVLPASALQPE